MSFSVETGGFYHRGTKDTLGKQCHRIILLALRVLLFNKSLCSRLIILRRRDRHLSYAELPRGAIIAPTGR